MRPRALTLRHLPMTQWSNGKADISYDSIPIHQPASETSSKNIVCTTMVMPDRPQVGRPTHV
jgi:hypothetical protein